ncbi:putative serine protease K12H4.7 [Eurosta solidaginis]|uniref:putative serine protease K12H4.7 n=1 Tax=Eurosta solidaginis TaxID=178769 RepID=UPI0035308391
MRWRKEFALLVGIALIAATSSAPQQLKSENDENIFKRTFKTLHQEPPPPESDMKSSRATPMYRWIKQKLDNFNESDTREWQMRYIINDEFYVEGGPFFIFVGGEWEISPRYVTGGHFYDMAKEHHGYLFYTEHRYYGESRPTSNMDNENIQYLSARQALADLAHFIVEMHEIISGASQSKVILAGGSYSATMVTWFMKLYPDLAAGAWASSAPILAKVNFVEYKEITGESIRLMAGEQCYKRIENGIAEMEALLANKRGAEVKAMLQLCDAFDESNDMDLWTLFSEISDLFAGVVQGHRPGKIEGACNKIMKGNDDVDGLATYLLSRFDGKTCNDLRYKAILKTLIDTSFSDNIMRQWTYQTCNEFGWYQTSGSRNQPFGTKFPVTYYTQMCSDIYGDKFTATFINNQINATNELFGGLEPNVENVYFSHGQLDPWRALGIQDEPQATVIPHHAHCTDFGSISAEEAQEMRASKEKLTILVRKWLGVESVADNF